MPSYLLLSLLGLVLLFPLAIIGAAERPHRVDRSYGRPDLGRSGVRRRTRVRAAVRALAGAAVRGGTSAARPAEPVLRVPVYRYDAAGRCTVDAWTLHLN